MAIITADDILIFRPDADPRQVEALISDVLAAASAIPGFRPDEPDQAKAARALKVLRWAIIRRLDSGSGAETSVTETAGPWTQTHQYGAKSLLLLTDEDLAELRRIYRSDAHKAFMINPAPRARVPL